MRKILVGLLIIAVVATIAWFFVGCFTNPGLELIQEPNAADAKYSIEIINSGELIYTNDVEISGDEGQRKIVVHDYWEVQGSTFERKEVSLVLDEAIFGEIKVKERNK